MSTRIFDLSSKRQCQSSSRAKDEGAVTCVVVVRRLWSGIVVGVCLQRAIRFTIIVAVCSIKAFGRVVGDIAETQGRGGGRSAAARSVDVCVHGGHEVSLEAGRWRVFISRPAGTWCRRTAVAFPYLARCPGFSYCRNEDGMRNFLRNYLDPHMVLPFHWFALVICEILYTVITVTGPSPHNTPHAI